MKYRTRIKVCGITEAEDARSAVTAGADGLGFIFAPQSPRHIDPDRAKKITSELPPLVNAIGVFVDENIDVVEEIVQYCGLSLVQLHGSETPEYCKDVSCRVVKSFSIRPATVSDELARYEEVVSGFLLDTYHREMAGGTGKVFDWGLVDHLKPSGPVILAGGLTPDNVADAIRQVRPFAVDVNSGVEYQPGRKDPGKLIHFAHEVRKADELAYHADTPFLA
jgi:phosphoribosylanthranilate isomerase